MDALTCGPLLGGWSFRMKPVLGLHRSHEAGGKDWK
jgi:hypothetical protein